VIQRAARWRLDIRRGGEETFDFCDGGRRGGEMGALKDESSSFAMN